MANLTPTNRLNQVLKKPGDSLPTAPVSGELLQVAKAVHDEMLAQLRSAIKLSESKLQSHLDSTLGRELDRRFNKLHLDLTKQLEHGLEQLRKEVSTHTQERVGQAQHQLLKSLGGELKGLVEQTSREGLSNQFKSLAQVHETRLKELRGNYDKGLMEVRDALKQEKGIVALLGKMLREELNGDVANLLQSHEVRLKELQEYHVKEVAGARSAGLGEVSEGFRKELEQRSKSFEEALSKARGSFQEALAALKDSFDVRFVESAKNQECRLDELHAAQEQAQQRLLTALKSLPAPVVEFAPQVHVPRVEAPAVNVNVPQVKAPEVHVSVPRRKVRKTIKYDDAGRPEVIEEHEMSEEDE